MIDTLIIDRGHGDINSKGIYTTAPYKMHTFENGDKVYEGHENTKYALELGKIAQERCFNVEYTIDPNSAVDLSLRKRVIRANSSINKNNALFISCHNNASNSHKGKGSEIFTSIGQTLSDIFAEEVLKQWGRDFPNRSIRTDKLDGDSDKEANFYVLKNTIMPAILLEVGFFDNRQDYEWLSNPINRNRICLGTILGIEKAICNLYGRRIGQ